MGEIDEICKGGGRDCYECVASKWGKKQMRKTRLQDEMKSEEVAERKAKAGIRRW